MSDVVLIYPITSYLDSINKKPYLPLSLLSASAYAAEGYKVKIIDQRIDKHWKNKVQHELNKNPILVGVTAQTGNQITYGLEASKFVKQCNRDIPVVWGGIHPTLLPRQTLMNGNIDVIVEGEGEIILYNLIKAIENKKPLKRVNGIWYKEDNSIKGNKPERLVNLDNIPELPYHFLNIKNYLMEFDGKKCLPIETSRGCNGSCAFCYNRSSPYKRTWRSMSIKKTIERIKQLNDLTKFDGFEIVDDNYFIDLKRAKEISHNLIKESLDKFWWTGGVRIDAILKMDANYLHLLEKSGCVQLNPGVESGSDRILKLIHKGLTVNDVLKASGKLNKTRIIPYYTFMGGFPTETVEDITATMKLASKLLKDNPKTKMSLYHSFRPLPNTQLFETAKKYGFKTPSSLEDWSNYDERFSEYPWLNTNMKKMIHALHFISLFVDRKCNQTDSDLVKLFAKFYRPIAKYRLNNQNFNLMFEHKLIDLFSIFKFGLSKSFKI